MLKVYKGYIVLFSMTFVYLWYVVMFIPCVLSGFRCENEFCERLSCFSMSIVSQEFYDW